MRNAPVLVAVLAVFGLAQDQSASRPSADVKLPVADQAKAFEEKNPIVVTVARAVPAPSGAETRRSPKDWVATVGKESFTLDKAGAERLAAHLRESSRDPGRKPESGLSERAVLVRADTDAPYAGLATILDACAKAGLEKISFEVAPSAAGKRQALSPGLPVDQGAASESRTDPNEILVLLAWSPTANRLERLVGSTYFSPTREGDAKLQELMKRQRDKYEKESVTSVVVIDSGPLVPWKSIVDVMDAAKRAGISKIEFAIKEPPK